MKAVIPSEDIRRGMFVTELDRPWLETPFPLQGFLVESDSQIAVLREMCRTVTIDRSHSLGSHFARPAFDENPSCGLPATVFRQADDASADDFAAICRQLRIEPRSPRYDTTPAIRESTSRVGWRPNCSTLRLSLRTPSGSWQAFRTPRSRRRVPT